jgi:cell division protein FtsN
VEQKQRLFIYDRREMGVLVVLGVLVAAFAFTLGIHLGKKVGFKTVEAPPPNASSIDTAPDKVPNRQELNEQSKGVQQATDEALNQALHDEVGRTGIKLDSPRQLALPEGPRTGNAGATNAVRGGNAEAFESIAAVQRKAIAGKFCLQVGSYPELNPARDLVDALEALGLKPLLRAAEVKGRGRWFRVYLGGYESKEEADQAGTRYQTQHVVDSYVVTKNVE